MLHAQLKGSEPVCTSRREGRTQGTRLAVSPFCCPISRLQTPDTAMADTGVDTETPLLLFGSSGEGIAAKQIQASVAGVGS